MQHVTHNVLPLNSLSRNSQPTDTGTVNKLQLTKNVRNVGGKVDIGDGKFDGDAQPSTNNIIRTTGLPAHLYYWLPMFYSDATVGLVQLAMLDFPNATDNAQQTVC